MAKWASRLLLAMLLLGDLPDQLEATCAECTSSGLAEAQAIDEDFCFIPIALRYREEAVQRISSHRHTSAVPRREVWPLPVPGFASEPEQVHSFPLSSLDPVYAFMCLRR